MIRRTKESIIKSLESWGATPDPTVPNVWWFNGHCILLREKEDGNWETEEL